MENIFDYYDYYHSRYWHDENHRKIKDTRMYEILLHRIVGRMILEDMDVGYERLLDSDNLVSIIKEMFLEDTDHLSIFCMREQEIIHSLLNKVICDERFNGEKKDDDEIRLSYDYYYDSEVFEREKVEHLLDLISKLNTRETVNFIDYFLIINNFLIVSNIYSDLHKPPYNPGILMAYTSYEEMRIKKIPELFDFLRKEFMYFK